MSNCNISPYLEKKYGKENISYIYDYNGKEEIDSFFNNFINDITVDNIFDIYSPTIFTPKYYEDNGYWFMYYKLKNNLPLTTFEDSIYKSYFNSNINNVKNDINLKRLNLKTIVDPLFEREIRSLETFNQAKELFPYKNYFFKKLNDEKDIVQYISQIYTKEFKDFFGDWESDVADKSTMSNIDGSPALTFHIDTSNDEEFISFKDFLHKNSTTDVINNIDKFEDTLYRLLMKSHYNNFTYTFTELTKKILEAFPTNKEKYKFLISRLSDEQLQTDNDTTNFYQRSIKTILNFYEKKDMYNLKNAIETFKLNLTDTNSSLRLYFSNDLFYIIELYKDMFGVNGVYYLYPAFLNIRNPYMAPSLIHNRYIQRLLDENPEILTDNDGIVGLEDVYTPQSKANVDSYIVFSSDQVKSLFNNGEYNKENPNIYYRKVKEKTFGFVTFDNIVFIDKSTLDNPNTMFHEFYHLFDKVLLENSKVSTKEKIIIEKANSLVRESGYLNKVQKDDNYKNLSLELQLIEARSQMIGDFAENRFNNKSLIGRLKQLVNDIYNYIKSLFKENLLDNYSAEQIFNMNMYDFNNVVINTMLGTDKRVSNDDLFNTLKTIFKPYYKEVITDYNLAKDIIAENDKLEPLNIINSFIVESSTNRPNGTIDIRLGTKWNLPYDGKIITDLIIYYNQIKDNDFDKANLILDNLYKLIVNNNPILNSIPIIDSIDKRDVIAGAASDLSYEDIIYFLNIGNSAINMPAKDRTLMTKARHVAHKNNIYDINFVLSPYTSNKILKLSSKKTVPIDKIIYKEYLTNIMSKKESYENILNIKNDPLFKYLYDSIDYNSNLNNILDYDTQNYFINLLKYMPNDKSDIDSYFTDIENNLKNINNGINAVQDKFEKSINDKFFKYLESLNIDTTDLSLNDYYNNKEAFNLQLFINTEQYVNVYDNLFNNIAKWEGYKKIDKSGLSEIDAKNLAIMELLKSNFKNTKKDGVVNYSNQAKDYLKEVMDNFNVDKESILIDILNNYKSIIKIFTEPLSSEKNYTFTQARWTNIFKNIPLKVKGDLVSQIDYLWIDSSLENILSNKNVSDNIYFDEIETLLDKEIVFNFNYILTKRVNTLKNLSIEEIDYINTIIIPTINKKLEEDVPFRMAMTKFMRKALKAPSVLNIPLGKDNNYYSNIEDVDVFVKTALTDNRFINYLEARNLLEDIYVDIFNNIEDNNKYFDYKNIKEKIIIKFNNVKRLNDKISLIQKYPENLQFSDKELIISNNNINVVINFNDIGYKSSDEDSVDNILENLSKFAKNILDKFKEFDINLDKLNDLDISIEEWNLLTPEEQNNILYCH